MVEHRRIAAAVFVILLGTAASAGCASETPEENSDAACSSVEELGSAVEEAQIELDEDSTVEEVRAQRDNLEEKVQAALEDLGDVQQDRADELDEAYQQLASSVENLEDDATVTEAVQSIQEEVAAIGDARGGVWEELSCEDQAE